MSLNLSLEEKERHVNTIAGFDVGQNLNRFTHNNISVTKGIIANCLEVFITNNNVDSSIQQHLYYFVQAFNYYIGKQDSMLRDNIRQGSLVGLPDTLNAIYNVYKGDSTPSAPIIDKLIKDKTLPTQTGGQKIRKYRKYRKYRKTRTNPSKSNIRNKRRRTRRRRYAYIN